MNFESLKIQKYLPLAAVLLIFLGILFRFHHITANDFVFYDEGYYLNWNRPLGEALSHHRFTGFDEFVKAVDAYSRRSLASGKALWFMLVDARFFFADVSEWFIARLWAAFLGVVTLGLTFLFARKFFNNDRIAWFAAALLAVLPSHVFYSRIGMQESLSTVLVLAGFYFYLFPATFKFWRIILAGVFWGLAYFSNYRLIMLPVLITFCELYLAFSLQRWPDFRRWLWAIVAFLACLIIGGNLNNGQNSVVIFSWVFHQASMASEQRDWLNIFSYPYYLFRLETFLFATFFFTNFYLFFKRDRRLLLPFALVLLQMAVFTCASEKGARYVGVVLPFMAMAVAYVIYELFIRSKDKVFRLTIFVLSIAMVVMMVHKSLLIVRSQSAYRSSASYIYALDSKAKFMSSQNYIQSLYAARGTNVHAVPSSFEVLINEYKDGYRYLVLCPQAYISLTENKQRFTPQLRGYLGFLVARFQPKKVYENFSPELLERFVLEHNENLPRSIRFLNSAKRQHFGVLRVYELDKIIPPMLAAIAKAEANSVEKKP